MTQTLKYSYFLLVHLILSPSCTLVLTENTAHAAPCEGQRKTHHQGTHPFKNVADPQDDLLKL